MERTFHRSKKWVCATVLGALLASMPNAHAYDVKLLANTKEAESVSYSDKTLRNAKAALAPFGDLETFSNQAYALLGATLTDLEKNNSFCDLNIYRLFLGKLTKAGYAASPETISNLLIYWRSENKIDDLLFETMEQIAKLNASLIVFAAPATPAVESAADHDFLNSLMTRKGMLAPTVASAYRDYEQSSLHNPLCTLERWENTAGQLASVTQGNTATLREFNFLAREKGFITNDTFNLLEFYRVQGTHEWNITLSRYLATLKQVKDKSFPAKPRPEDFGTNTLSSSVLRHTHGQTTFRKSLYYRFNGQQINMMSDLLKDAFELMDANSSDLTFHLSGGKDKSFPLDPMAQYDAARWIMLEQENELTQSTFFGGQGFTHEDILTAAMETGLINETMLDSALKIDDLWNPHVPTWKKISDYAFQVTGTASIFLPPPYNVITSVGLMILNGALSKKSSKPDSRNNPNRIIH